FISDTRLGSTSLSVGSDAGFVGGGQIGYNFQTGAFVFGVEADIQYADLSSKANWSGYSYTFNGGGSQYFGTVRARAGYAFDRVTPPLRPYGNRGAVNMGDFIRSRKQRRVTQLGLSTGALCSSSHELSA